MRHKISKFFLIIFLFSSNFKLFGNSCDECGCLCCCNDKIKDPLMNDLIKKCKTKFKDVNINNLQTDCEKYIEHEISRAKNFEKSNNNINKTEEEENYNFQTNVLREFVNHYKVYPEVLPDKFFLILDILLKILISNEDLINIMKKELIYKNKEKKLRYVEINDTEIEKIIKDAAKNRSIFTREKNSILADPSIFKNPILEDLPRTFPYIKNKDEKSMGIFKKIIYNFIYQLNKDNNYIGYWQGMNFYAGFFFILCEDEDPSGELAFNLLSFFMTKKWEVNNYIINKVIISKENSKKSICDQKKEEDTKYSIMSFYRDDFLILNSITDTLYDNIPLDKSRFNDETINQIKMCFLQWFMGYVCLDMNMVKKIFFFILLFKNCKIFFDIANFAAKFFLPLNNRIDLDLSSFYLGNIGFNNSGLFSHVCKRYTKENKSILIQ